MTSDLDTSPGSDRLELLRTFVRIVEAGSLSAAAQQLGMTQPTVSRRLQALERLLGQHLLQRSTHHLSLTEDGQRCFQHAQHLVQTWQQMQADLRGEADVPRGRLRVLVPHAFGQEQLLDPMLRFLTRHPQVSIEWTLEDREVDFVAAGIDCAIHIGPVQQPDMVVVHLADVPRIVVAAPALLGAQAPPTTPDELQALPWLSLTGYYRERVTLHGDDGSSVELRVQPRLLTDSLFVLRRGLLAGLGAGIASHWVVAEALDDGRLVQLLPHWSAPSFPVNIVYPYTRFMPARLRAFIDVMKDAMPQVRGMRRRE